MQMENEVKQNTGKLKSFFREYGTKKNLMTGVGVLSAATLVGVAIRTRGFSNFFNKEEVQQFFSKFKKETQQDTNIPVTLN